MVEVSNHTVSVGHDVDKVAEIPFIAPNSVVVGGTDPVIVLDTAMDSTSVSGDKVGIIESPADKTVKIL